MKAPVLPDICGRLAEAAADLVNGGVVYFNWKMELSTLLLAAKKEIESLRAAEIKKIRAYEGRNEGEAMCRLEPPGTPLPMPDLSDMDHFHRMIGSGRLGEILDQLGQIGMQKAPKCKEDDS